jgi:choline dehydrogenase-like flavoprotein
MEVFDAVVVGSGASGGWAAKKLTEAGARVALIEAGRQLEPKKDFSEHVQPYDLRFRDSGLVPRIFSAKQGPIDEYTQQFFVKDTENPFTFPEARPFSWTRSRHVGGKTISWGRGAVRMSDVNFKAASRDGHGIDWPISYAELAPFYDEVEEFIGVSGGSEGSIDMPAGKYQPPMNMSCAERVLDRTLRERFGRKLIMFPCANLTMPLSGRAACHYCGPCERGCTAGAYFSSPVSTLPAARETGKLTLFTDCVVSHVTETDEGRARGVWCVDRTTRAHREVRGRVIVLCASALESTRILLNSRSSRFPNGLGNTSGVLGHYLMDHPMGLGAIARFEGLARKDEHRSRRPTFTLIPRFRNLQRRDTKFIRGYHYTMVMPPWSLSSSVDGWSMGTSLKARIETQATTDEATLLFSFFGECLGRYENHCRLNAELTDAWGIPTLHVDAAYGDNERLMAEDAVAQAVEMAEAAGAKVVKKGDGKPYVMGSAIHEVGTARMGADRKTSYLNAWNQSHEVKNLFVLDGASFSSSANQNPTLTIMALAARAGTYIAGELQRRNL